MSLFSPMKAGAIASLLALGAASGAAGADLRLVSYALGDSLARTSTDTNFDCGQQALRGFTTTCHARAPQRLTIGAVPLNFLALHYEGGKLAAVEVRLSELGHQEAAQALAAEFGEAKAEAEKLRAGMGGVFENAIFTWRQGEVLLRVEQFFRSITTSSVILTTEPQLGKLVIPKPTHPGTGIKDL